MFKNYMACNFLLRELYYVSDDSKVEIQSGKNFFELLLA